MTTTPAADQIIWTGANARAVRALVHDGHDTAPGGHKETWFLTRAATAPTGGQAWRYARANAADDADWGDGVTAAVYDPRRGAWLPLRPGDTIRVAGTGFDVHPKRA